MKTFLEELMKIPDGKKLNDAEKALMELLDKTVLIKVDNVAEYYFMQSDQEDWDLREDFPNVAPPFDNFFMEYTPPGKSNSNGKIINMEFMRNARFGLLFKSYSAPKSDKLTDPRWLINIITFVKINGEIIYHPGIITMLAVQGDGRVAIMDGRPIVTAYNKELYTQDQVEMLSDYNHQALNPALLAICFMHCKNVTQTEYDPCQLAGKRNRYKPRVRYLTLEINPMRKVLESEGGAEESGLKRALHICRGHFKNFEGKGLFGKYTGTFWWGDQVRGKAENGRVEKDYSVLTGIK